MKINSDTFKCAIEHIISSGDTDLFPRPFELSFYRACIDQVSVALSELDLSNYNPMSLVESLVPKMKYGFRVAHQPYPVDTLIYTALVLFIYDDVERGRDAPEHNRAFSYRKIVGLDSNVFTPERNFRNWIGHLAIQAFREDCNYVIKTDISDFYLRIYRHRLENILSHLSGNAKAVRIIEKLLSDWRGRQSFGLPVGSSASRLLAEAALNDTDMALISEGYDFTRYVDDMVIFLKKDQDPYAALAFLAKQLSSNEGLSLNNQKTKVLEWKEFIASVDQNTPEDDPSQEALATEKLFWAAYCNEDIDQDALEALMKKDLQKELEDLLSESFWDMGSIRIVIHAMRLVKNPEVAAYIRINLPDLVPFAKDVCLLIKDFIEAEIDGFGEISGEITDLLLSIRMRPLDCARAWFLDLGVQKLVRFDSVDIRRLDALTGTLDIRQLHLIRWRSNDLNYFRSRKTRVSEITIWSQPSFIFGASCLPKDEYEHWIRGIKSRLQFPLAKEFTDWCLRNHGKDPFIIDATAGVIVT
ncbi:RNA-directed DNA polymerase [Methylobacterium sp. WL64]|uniref:RNA-directed DNA polymerase n=1 Tax=Methylobacterium sp. WL64 TaxID=2603894 RepID=UPI0011CA4201|nr:RNA-directed DNA polymerase [Methylobacterium sp. WL64]TXN00544.1 RNA-directed DNA polymerase [Methylobacterium sp. WL64]